MTTDPIKPPAPPPPPSGGDSRVDAFLQKAAPIIAMERGINARSRVLLEALARDMKLPDELFDQGIHMLQGSPPVVKEKSRWQKAFGEYVRRKLENLDTEIFTLALESRMIQKGVKKYMLSEDQARDEAREVVDEMGMRRITLSEAERHVADMVENKVGDAAWVDDKTLTRLRSAGVGWGLSVDQVDAIVREYTSVNRDQQEREDQRSIVLLTVAGMVVVLVLCVLAGFVLLRPDGSNETASGDDTDRVAVDPGSVRVEVKRVEAPEWWSVSLKQVTSSIRIKVPEFQPLYEQMASSDSEARAESYEEIVKYCSHDWEEIWSYRNYFAKLFTECYKLDPGDDAADRFREAILGLAKAADDELPSEMTHYKRAFWSVSTAIDALKSEELPDERASKLEIALGRTVGTAVIRNRDKSVLRNDCFQGLAKTLYRQLADNARRNVNRAIELHGRLNDELRLRRAESKRDGLEFITLEEQNRLDADYLKSVLLVRGDHWVRYSFTSGNGLIAAVLAGGSSERLDPVNAAKMIDVLEHSSDEGLRASISGILQRITGSSRPRSMSFEEYAKASRKALGITAATTVATAADRWKVVGGRAAEIVARRNLTPDHNELLHDLVKVSHVATMACAVAQQEPGFPVFDQLLKDGPPKLAAGSKDEAKEADLDVGPFKPATTTGGSRRTPSKADKEDLAHYIEELKRYPDVSVAQRISYMRGLGNLTAEFSDISPDQAEVVARYLLGPKKPQSLRLTKGRSTEDSRLLEFAGKFKAWNHLKLALADQVETTEMKSSDVEKLWSAILKKGVVFDDAIRWRQMAHREMLEDVLENLKDGSSSEKSNSGGDQLYEFAARGLTKLYRTRASVLGFPPDKINGATSVSDILQLMVDRNRSRLGGVSKTSTAGKFIASLPQQLRALEYLGNNDIQRTVSLQRVRIRLMAIEMKSKRTDRGASADKLVADLIERDTKATDVIAQVMDGELTLLNMWLLLAP